MGNPEFSTNGKASACPPNRPLPFAIVSYYLFWSYRSRGCHSGGGGGIICRRPKKSVKKNILRISTQPKNSPFKNCKQRKMLYLLSGIFSMTEERHSYSTEPPCGISLVIFYPDTGCNQAQRTPAVSGSGKALVSRSQWGIE